MRYVKLESLISAADPEKARIEETITRACAVAPGGPWTVTIERPRVRNTDGTPAWSITVAGMTQCSVGVISSAAEVDDFVTRSIPRSARIR